MTSPKNIIKLYFVVSIDNEGKYFAYFSNGQVACGSSPCNEINPAVLKASQALVSCGVSLLCKENSLPLDIQT